MDKQFAKMTVPQFVKQKTINFFRILRVFLLVTVVLFHETISFAASKEVCETLETVQECPSNTCCRQSKCDAENNEYRCCEDPDSAGDCSNCPACGKLISFFHVIYIEGLKYVPI